MWQGLFGIIVEMLLAVDEEGAELARQLAKFSCSSRAIPANWKESLTQNHYRRRCKSLQCGKYRGLNLPDQVMKLLEQVLDFSMCNIVNIDGMQFGFVSDRGTTDTILMVCSCRQSISLLINRSVLALLILTKPMIPWTLMGFSVNKWAVRVNQRMCSNALSHVQVYGQYRKSLLWEFVWLCSSSSTLHSSAGSTFVWVLHQSTMGNFLCGAHYGNPGGVYLPDPGMKGWHVE